MRKQTVAPRTAKTNGVLTTDRYMISVKRPSSKELRGYNRAERYNLLRESAVRHRQEIVQWLHEHGFDSELVAINEPTAFNILFCEGTPALATALRNAPPVLSIAKIGDFTMEVLHKQTEGTPST